MRTWRYVPIAAVIEILIALLLQPRCNHFCSSLSTTKANYPHVIKNSRQGTCTKMTTMEEIPNLLASTFSDSYIGPVTVSPSQIMGNDVNCGNGLFLTASVSTDEVLFLIRPMDDAVVSVEHAWRDADCGKDFERISEMYEGGETVAMAGWLAKTKICDMLDRAFTEGGSDAHNEDKEGDDGARFLSEYISALPWQPEDQDHIIWWRQEETDRLIGTTTGKNAGDSAMIDEVLRIRTEVSSATPLLADVIGPSVRSKLSRLSPDVVADILGIDESIAADTNLACNLLLSTYLRGAFVVLLTRSFDETFEGIGSSSSSSSQGGRLVPVFDTMQHTTGTPNVYHVYDISSDCIGVMAARDLEEGEELVISYYVGLDPGVFGARFGFVPGEKLGFRRMLEERSGILFSSAKQ